MARCQLSAFTPLASSIAKASASTVLAMVVAAVNHSVFQM